MDKTPQDDLAVMLLGPGAAPLPKIEEEAIALLVACNSLLNSLALQGVRIPQALLTDLTVFCRNGVGFGVPFADVAKRAFPTEQDPQSHLAELGRSLDIQASWASTALEKVAEMPGDPNAARTLLLRFGQMELLRERICGYMGWSRILINAQARMSVDEREAARKALGGDLPG